MSREAVELVLRAVRPSVHSEDGDLDLVVAEGTNVRVRLTGLCDGCPYVALSAGVRASDDRLPREGISLGERLAEYEAVLIARALHASFGNKSRAARLLGIKRTTLADRITRLGARLRDPAVDVAPGPHIGAQRA